LLIGCPEAAFENRASWLIETVRVMPDRVANHRHPGVQSAVTALRSPEWAAEYLGMPLAWVIGAADRGDQSLSRRGFGRGRAKSMTRRK